MTSEERLTSLGIILPAMPQPVANYTPYRIAGDLLFLSGQGPRRVDGTYSTGRVGRDVTVETAHEDARATGLQLLAVAKQALTNLDRVAGVVKVFGMVNAEPEFADHPRVINGCSDLFVDVFGEAGRHARSAVGQGSLPNGMTVEIEAIFQIKPAS
jgi:enamine deaminase RidA (YjgF/YER057c/UK114 family)